MRSLTVKKSVLLKAAVAVLSFGFIFSAQAKRQKNCSCVSKEVNEGVHKLSDKAKDAGAKIKEASGVGKMKARDAAITAKVKAALALRDTLKSTGIKVTTENQNVLLSGLVKTWEQKELAESVARSVEGVKNVENLLAVRSKK